MSYHHDVKKFMSDLLKWQLVVQIHIFLFGPLSTSKYIKTSRQWCSFCPQTCVLEPSLGLYGISPPRPPPKKKKLKSANYAEPHVCQASMQTIMVESIPIHLRYTCLNLTPTKQLVLPLSPSFSSLPCNQEFNALLYWFLTST